MYSDMTIFYNTFNNLIDYHFKIHDGAGQFGELLGKYCGSIPPPVISSSTNKLWIRFFSDGTVEGAGAIGTLEAVDCKQFLVIIESIKRNNVLIN